MPRTSIAEQLVQALHGVALRTIVDVGAHQVVVVGQIRIKGIDGHQDLAMTGGVFEGGGS